MNFSTEQTLASQAKTLGESASADCFEALAQYCRSESPLVRRTAASALGKLAGVVDAAKAVAVLGPLLADAHPQVRQYAAKALSAYGSAAASALPALRDLFRNPAEKDYVKRTVKSAGVLIKEAMRMAEKAEVRTCMRCGKIVGPDEYARSQRFIQLALCDICFDHTATERRNFETGVEDKKRIRTLKGTLVQSDGERRIADWLERRGISYRYDDRLRIIEGFQIRPDFYLPEYDVYIEYRGMDTPRYKAGMCLKQDLYMHAGKKLISLYPADKDKLDDILPAKLRSLLNLPPPPPRP
jgi:hypothetical protein